MEAPDGGMEAPDGGAETCVPECSPGSSVIRRDDEAACGECARWEMLCEGTCGYLAEERCVEMNPACEEGGRVHIWGPSGGWSSSSLAIDDSTAIRAAFDVQAESRLWLLTDSEALEVDPASLEILDRHPFAMVFPSVSQPVLAAYSISAAHLGRTADTVRIVEADGCVRSFEYKPYLGLVFEPVNPEPTCPDHGRTPQASFIDESNIHGWLASPTPFDLCGMGPDSTEDVPYLVEQSRSAIDLVESGHCHRDAGKHPFDSEPFGPYATEGGPHPSDVTAASLVGERLFAFTPPI